MIPISLYENSVFSSPDFLSCIASESGTIETDSCYVSYVIKRSLIFSKLVFTSKILLEDGTLVSKELEKIVMPKIIEKAKLLKVDYIAQPMAHVYFRSVPECAIGVKWSSPLIDLNVDENVLLSNMHKKHRNVVKRAQKEAIMIDFDAPVEDVYKLINCTMNRQSRNSVSLNELSKLKNSLARVLFVTCSVNGKLQGAAVIPYDNLTGYYLYGGSVKSVVTGSLNYMHFQIMLKLKSLNIKQYDLMGYRLFGTNDEKIIGIQRFKTRFGTKIEEGVTWKYVINPMSYWLQEILLKIRGVINRSPYYGDLIDQGRKYD